MQKIIALLTLISLAVYAADVAPETWITNYVYSANTVSITNTTFTANGAATADLDATTGDIREVTKALLEELYDSQASLASATNAPAYMYLTKVQKINDDEQLTTTFTVIFTSDISTSSIVAE